MSQARSSDRTAFIESAFEATFDLKVVASLDGSVLDANRTAVVFAHMEYEALLGCAYWDAPGVREQPEVVAWLRDAATSAAAGELPRREARLRRPDGSETYFDLTVRSIAPTTRSGRFLLIEGRDITDCARAQQSARTEVADAEARFRTVLDAGFDAFVIVRADRDDDGKVRLVVCRLARRGPSGAGAAQILELRAPDQRA